MQDPVQYPSNGQFVLLQLIYDSVAETYVGKFTMLIGDAGTMTRPHTASGATKALEDALALQELAKTAATIEEFLGAYDVQRFGQAKTLSQIGRRIGQKQVSQTPDWGKMLPKDFEEMHKAILSSGKLYLCGVEQAEN